MAILVVWLFFAFVVAIAAGSRGRSGAGWFILAVIISPLLALILVLVMPNLRQERMVEKLTARSQPPALTAPKDRNLRHHALLGGRSSRLTIERDDSFEPDGVFAGIPYRVTASGAVEAVMQGKVVRFQTMERFTGALGHPTG